MDKVNKLTVPDKTIPIAKLIELRSKGHSVKAIAQLMNCSKANITQRLRPYKEHVESIKSFTDSKLDILHVLQSMFVSAITPAKIKGLSGLQLVTCVGILQDKIATIQGLSQGTGGVSINFSFNDNQIPKAQAVTIDGGGVVDRPDTD